jgi:ribose 5-phosphate isomerase B
MMLSKLPLIIGSDHAAFPLKEEIKAYLKKEEIEVEDVGTNSLDSVDYPDYGIMVASRVSSGEFERGILLCGTGIGMSIVANRFRNIRAALCTDLYAAIMSRKHNNSNILVLGGRVTGVSLALEIVKIWLETQFEGGRHQSRLDKFNNIGRK